MDLHARLSAMVQAVPPGGSVTIPRDWLAEELEVDDSLGDDVLDDYTLEQVAEATGRRPSTIRTWCNTGRLPGAYKLAGKTWRIPRAGLDVLRDGKPHPKQEGIAARADLGAWRNLKVE